MASDILTDEGLDIIPVYFNGWHSTPDFGGFTYETLRQLKHCSSPSYANGSFRPCDCYLSEAMEALAAGSLLLHDLSNEPYNGVYDIKPDGRVIYMPGGFELVSEFLYKMSRVAREADARPITVGSQGFFFEDTSDLDMLAPIVDVFSMHPYVEAMTTMADHEAYIMRLIERAERLGKPILVTESCWGADDDADRELIIRRELSDYCRCGVGFIAHGLCQSPVADLHPLDGLNPGMYMPFLDAQYNIRPHHGVFNDFS